MAYDAEHFTVTEVRAPPSARDNMIALRNLIASQPARMFDYQESFPAEFSGNMADLEIHNCKTPMCILGWGRALAKDFHKEVVYEWLGLTQAQGQQLCFADAGYTITRDKALTVLDHYLATGEVDWSVA